MNKPIHVVQSLSSVMRPGSDSFRPDAKPGMFQVGYAPVEELRPTIDIKVESCCLAWIAGWRPGAKAMRILYQGSGLALLLSPLAAEQLGELKVGHTYCLSTVEMTTRGIKWHAIQAEEIL